MKMSTVVKGQRILAGGIVLAIAIVLCGCPSAETKKTPSPKEMDAAAKPEAKSAAESRPAPKVEKPAKTPAGEPEKMVTEAAVEAKQKPRDLGPPLVDNPGQLKPLSQNQPVWIDMKNKQIVVLGEVCEAAYALEYFASNAMKAYESVVSVNVTPSIIHAGLLSLGAKPGHPVRFEPRFSPPTGTEIAVEVRWKGRDGKVQSAPAQHWIRNINTKKQMDVNWVFAGSFFVNNEKTGEEYYQADYGALICLANMPDAMLDLPIEVYSAVEARSFEAFKERLPPAGTPTTLLFKPILEVKPPAEKPAQPPAPKVDKKTAAAEKKALEAVDKKIAEAEQKAREAAESWLDLIDRQQYSRCWETASERLNAITARREFIKSLNDTRKPLGKVKSRKLLSAKYTRKIPDAPDGQYVVVQYTTSFENKPSAVEMVTMMLNGDDKWRVLGYHFK